MIPTGKGTTFEGGQRVPCLMYENSSIEGGLDDLRRDPGERYNLRESHPEIAAALEKIASEARRDLGVDLTGNQGENRREPGAVAGHPL